MLLSLALAGGPARAAADSDPGRAEVGAMADSTAARPRPGAGATADSTAARPRPEVGTAVEPDSARSRLHRGRFDAPRWVMLRSLAVPGWGQLHNGSWLKAVLLGGGETAIISGLVEDDRRIRRLRAQADAARAEGDNDGFNAAVDAYNQRLNHFVSRQWLLGGLLVYSLMDAYVDAHFKDFKVEFEYDPALPGGKPPAKQSRVFLRWDF